MAENKMLHVRIYTDDSEALKALPMTQIDRGCMGGIKKQEDGGLVFEALVPESLPNAVKDKRIRFEVLDDALEKSRERQRQVGRGNRFTGENWVPRGLGKKIREEAP